MGYTQGDRTCSGGYGLATDDAGRLRATLKALKVEMHRRWHEPVHEVGAWLRSVLRGHYQYYGVSGNFRLLARFRWDLVRMWRRALLRRSQRSRFSWTRLKILVQRWLPLPHIIHPHPARRLRVVT